MSWSCPVHGTAKIKTKGTNIWCAGKMPDGSWCANRPEPAPKATPFGPWPGTGVTPVSPSNNDARMIAAMDFASRLYQGQGRDGEAAAMVCVRTALSLFS